MMCFCRRKKRVSVYIEEKPPSPLVLPPPLLPLPPPPIRIPKVRVKFSSVSSRKVKPKRNDKTKRKSHTR